MHGTLTEYLIGRVISLKNRYLLSQSKDIRRTVNLSNIGGSREVAVDSAVIISVVEPDSPVAGHGLGQSLAGFGSLETWYCKGISFIASDGLLQRNRTPIIKTAVTLLDYLGT